MRQLWLFLRAHGVDAHVDLVAEGPREDWSSWMADQIREADHILIVASPAYRAQAQEQNGPEAGLGQQWESPLIRDAFYRDQDARNRFVPVILSGQSLHGVPDFLAAATTTVYPVREFTVAGAETLLGLLTGRPGEERSSRVVNNTITTDDLSGTVIQVGGNVENLTFLRQLARSHYLAQVRAMAPPVLLDREAEIAELTDFCTRSGPGGYQLWQADAWAGKTALLASFVCDPPERTRIVPFFITDRRGPQSDREAFFDIVIEQLAEILNESMPANATPATRPAQFLGLLEAAADSYRKQGRRLVLIVDGLDNDTGTDEYSIAALLPARPPAGLRIVASVRPDPPLPDDLPDDHPLRDSGIVRTLPPSPHARVIRGEALRDVKRLLGGGDPAGRDLLGLVVASEGGLSGRDLRELTGHSFERIERALETVTGRAFARRAAHWTDAATPQDLYILAHEELQQVALTRLEGEPLAGFRAMLHTWADTYRKRRWPAQTPEYLLRDYFRVMRSEGDLPRMLEFALDNARQDRMLDMSGGDVTALDEIVTTQNAAAGQDVPDLRSMILLGTRLSDINQRNAGLPTGLPAVWARLGRLARADAMVRSISNRRAQLLAWGELLRVLADEGDDDRVRAILADAVPQAIDAAGKEAPSTVELIVEKLAKAGHAAYAAELAARLPAGEPHIRALTGVAAAWARTGDAERARAAADEAARTARRHLDSSAGAQPANREAGARAEVRVLAELARMWGALGAVDEAHSLAGRADQIALSVLSEAEDQAEARRGPTAHDNAKMFYDVAAAWHAAGDQQRARAAAAYIIGIAKDMTVSGGLGVSYMVWAVQAALRAHVEIGDLADAERIIEALSSEDRRRRPEEDTVGSAFRIAEAVHAWIESGRIARAEEIAGSIVDPDLDTQCEARIRVYAAAVPAWSESGELDRARGAAREVEELARSVGWPRDRVTSLTTAAHAWIDAGDERRAEAVARETQRVAATLSDMPKVSFLIAGSVSAESAAAARADSRRMLAGRDRPQDAADLVLRAAVPAATRAGAAERGEEFGRGITHLPSRAWAGEAARRMAALDQAARDEPFGQLVASVLDSDDAAWQIEDYFWGAVGGRSDLDGVEDFVRSVIGQTLDAWDVLAELDVATGAGDFGLCRALAERIELFARYIPMVDFAAQAGSVETSVLRSALPGDRSRIEALIRAVLSPETGMWSLSTAVRCVIVSGLFSIGKHRALAGVACVLKVRLLAAAADARKLAGDGVHAGETARAAEKVARSAATATIRSAALAVAARAWHRAGDRYHARALAREIEGNAADLEESGGRAWAFADAFSAWAWVEDLERAESALASVEDSDVRTVAALGLAAHVDAERADALIAGELRRGSTAWGTALYRLINLRPALLVEVAGKLLMERAE